MQWIVGHGGREGRGDSSGGAFGAPLHVWQLQDLEGTELMVAGNISALPHPDQLLWSLQPLTKGLKQSNK